MADTKTVTPKADLNYYYIKPTLNIPNVILILIIILFFCYLILKWNYINVNWENEKCNNANFFLAPLFGKDSATTLQQCTTDIINKTVSDSVGKLNLSSQISDLSGNIAEFRQSIKDQSGNQLPTTFNSAANIISGIQENVSNVKEALSRTLGSVLLNAYMYDGVIQSTQNLQNTDLVNMISQYDAVQKKVTSEAANPSNQLAGKLQYAF